MKREACLFAIALWLTASLAHAGRSCEAKAPSVQSVSQGLALALSTAQALDKTGAQVLILARAGQDLSKYDVRYSRLGLAYKTASGAWRVLHKLNQCGTAVASVYREGLGDFFMDDLWRHEAAWVVPEPQVQERLLALLSDDALSTRLHNPAYNMVSYAWGDKYQQSNQWALETLALAMEPTMQTRAQAQAWLQFKGYLPTTLKLGPLTRLAGSSTKANIAFDDHPNAKRFSDCIETVTVDSVFAWLQRAKLGGPTQQVSLPERLKTDSLGNWGQVLVERGLFINRARLPVPFHRSASISMRCKSFY